MNIFGGIAFIAAFKRYKNAKKAYNVALVNVDKEKEALLKTINEQQKYSNYEYENDRYRALEYYNRDPESVLEAKPAPGLSVYPFLLLGWDKLSGKYYRMKSVLRITNESSNNTYHIVKGNSIDNLSCAMFVTIPKKDVDHEAVAAAILDKEIILKPHQGIDITLSPGIPMGNLIQSNGKYEMSAFSILPKDVILALASPVIYYMEGFYPKTDALRKTVVEFKEQQSNYEGKELGISDIPVGRWLMDVLTCDVTFYYYTENVESDTHDNKNIRLAVYEGEPGKIIWQGQKKYVDMNLTPQARDGGVSENIWNFNF